MLNVFEAVSQTIGLPPGLLAALCMIESNHNPNAFRTHDGDGRTALGLCEIKIETAREVMPDIRPSDLFNPEKNAMAAGLYLKKKLGRYKNNIDQAIAAYNRGSLKYIEGKLSNQRYVSKVRKEWKKQALKASVLRLSDPQNLSAL